MTLLETRRSGRVPTTDGYSYTGATPSIAERGAHAAERIGDIERRALAEIGSHRAYSAGSMLAFEGAPSHEAMVVVDGEVKAVVSSVDGREVILDVLGPGRVIGELAVIDGGPHAASFEALGRVGVLAMALSDFGRYVRDHPAAYDALVERIAAQLRTSVRRQLDLGTGDAMQRLCRRLLELAVRFGVPGDGPAIVFESPLNQAELGSWSGLSRESVVKVMRTMRRLGWIDNVGATITIVEPESVRARAAGHRVSDRSPARFSRTGGP